MVKKIINNYLPEGSVFRNVSTLVSGAALGQLVVFLVSPVITRLYSPEEFGVMAIYASILGIISSISGLRYELAIPLTRTDGSAANILVLSLLCVVSTSIITLFIIIMQGTNISIWVNMPDIVTYLWLLPLGILLTGLYKSFNYWAIRKNNFNCIARTKIQQGVVGSIAQVGLGFVGFGVWGLLVGQIISQSSGLRVLIRNSYQQDMHLLSRINWQRIKQRARRYKRFPKYSVLQALANTSSTMLAPILFSVLFSLEMAGIYLLASRIMLAPLSLIGTSIGQVFHTKAADARRSGTLDMLMLRAFRYLLRLSLIPLITVGYFAPEIFAFVFGDGWQQAGTYTQWMIPWIIAQFVVSPLSIIVSVTENQLGGLVSQILFFVVRIASLILGASIGGSDGALFFYSISGVFVYFGLWLWMLKILNISYFSWVRFMSKDFLIYTLILLFYEVLITFVFNT